MQRIQCCRVSSRQQPFQTHRYLRYRFELISVDIIVPFPFGLTSACTDQGQAGAQSIEDGAAIGILLQHLPSDSPRLADTIEQRLEAFETVRRKRASLMQIFSNAGQDEAEKIRDEAARLLGDEKGLKVPSKHVLSWSLTSATSFLSPYPATQAFRAQLSFTKADDSGWTANQAEFHEFNFGYDVIGESEKVLQSFAHDGLA